MGKKIQTIISFALFLKKMGPKYFAFRVSRMLQSKLNIFKKRFTTENFRQISDHELDCWYNNNHKGIFLKREERATVWNNFNIKASGLEARIENYIKGHRLFFKHKWYKKNQLGDWNFNVQSQKSYPMEHWTELNLLDKELGDIKYVWEKSKFLEIQDFMVYDLVTSKSHATYILDNILDWIKKNPVNIGPNWGCSQEISLRLINWQMFLAFYKTELYNSYKTELKTVVQSIVEQILHVKENINYSKISVRNNHAFSELLGLYLVGDMFSDIKEISRFKNFGYKGFEEEFKFQIFEDGTDNQYSLNYYRTKIQLTSIFINQIDNKSEFIKKHSTKFTAMVNFFNTVIINDSGEVPNYGANDGSLYYKFNQVVEPTNFLPQILTFVKLVKLGSFSFKGENNFYDDYLWFQNTTSTVKNFNTNKREVTFFKDTGYLIINKKNIYAFIRLGKHRFRPSQSDNTHIDLWVNGKNILGDSGTYSYNIPKSQEEKYNFNVSKFHNVLVVNGDTQMKSFLNFILFDWTTVKSIKINDNINSGEVMITCELEAYKHINKKLKIARTFVLNYKNNTLRVTDSLNTLTGIKNIRHNWIVKNPKLIMDITSYTDEKELNIKSEEILIAEKYGNIINAQRFFSETTSSLIDTLITFEA